MAGSRGSKYYDIFLNYNTWLESRTGKGSVSAEQMELLRNIRDEGSLKASADKAQMSYRKAWGKLKEAEQMLDFTLVERTRGGSQGGESKLTEEGVKLVEAYDELNNEINKSIKKITRDFFQAINE